MKILFKMVCSEPNHQNRQKWSYDTFPFQWYVTSLQECLLYSRVGRSALWVGRSTRAQRVFFAKYPRAHLREEPRQGGEF
jgi:hypothetical protein